jgi:cellulose synthase/poly-beta-1,6-N-acetylglucosamine synthase-like glycosyltransferase/peptidoglycan/xylan/chitin deacetylase (PgdA/CDA1 family)
MKKSHAASHPDTPVFFDGSGRRWLLVRIFAVALGVLLFFFTVWTTPHVLNERRVPSFNSPHLQLGANLDGDMMAKQLRGIAKVETNNSTAVIGTGSKMRLVKIMVNPSGIYAAHPVTNEKTRQLSYSEVLYIGNEKYAYLRYGDERQLPPTIDQLANNVNRSNTAVIGDGPLVRLIEIVRNDSGTFVADPFTGSVLERASDDELDYINGDQYALQRYGHTEGKRIALTFDDGPDPIYTPQLLDLLSRESAQASFFVVGTNIAKYPEVASRLVREGHTIANHTLSHVDFDYVGNFEGVQQINQTQRMIVAAARLNTPFYRPPYGGNTDQSLRNSLRSILNAQKLGYVVTSYHFDSNDWQFNSGYKPVYPEFDGKDKVILVHDSGGDRTRTLAYVKELITQAKAQGYTFASLTDLYPQVPHASLQTQPGFADVVSLGVAQAVLVWPLYTIQILFGFSVMMIIVTTILNVVLALLNSRKVKRKKWKTSYRPYVTVVVPAYNESIVIVNSVRSLLQSNYRKIEVLIVDDGSSDDTWTVASRLDRRYNRVRSIHQENGGKASALNNAIAQAKGEIVICVDADTVFPPQTIGKLVRHFQDESVAAVAGVVKVGNVSSMLTRWQMLEYTVSIAIDRNAHSLINSIMIIPGACGAWRKTVVSEVGGFSHSTLAEDCDLTVKIQQLNRYRIVQENDAISYTEAPNLIGALTKQRFRWMFGNLQALWKHRNMVFNRHYRWLGMFIMPNSLISIIIPLFFWPLLAFISIQNVLNGNYEIILIYFLITLTIQFIVAAIGLRLAGERYALLWAVPFARFIYGPIRLYILYKTVITALRGSYVGWNKLLRAGTATYPVADKKPSVISVQPSNLSSSKT